MAIVLHDTLAGRKREFQPLEAGYVRMYLCGPTVYNFAHIGNARPAVVFDVLRRLLAREYEVTFARNITDVDDKINQASIESGKPIGEITARFIKAYNEDMSALGVQEPDIEPHATDNIPGMIAMIERLIERGHAYAADGHVLFSVASDPDYGELSKRDQRELLAGARVEVASYKREPGDFVLWKPSTPELPGWDSPWGRGRPGWHIECSAMCLDHLAPTIDIHCGGQDLVFPHHENEVAQSRCANNGAPLSRYWLHNGYLNIEQTKMSKSLGNVFLVRDLLGSHPGEVLRGALLAAHYRAPLDWSADAVSESRKRLDRLYGAVRGHENPESDVVGEPLPAVIAALSDDLNTPLALAHCFDLARELNRTDNQQEAAIMAANLRASTELLGLMTGSADAWFEAGPAEAGALSAVEIEAALAKRAAAKQDKDFAAADAIRDQLQAAGVVIEDGAGETRWRRASD